MVELVEVEDESFETKQAGPEENEDDYYTDTGMGFSFPELAIESLTSLQTRRFLPMMKTMFLKKRRWLNDYWRCAI